MTDRHAGSAFRYRDFSLFWASMVTSGFALQMSSVAIGWQVYNISGRPLDLGLVGLCEFLPLPLLALPAGQLADRMPRRTLLAIATLLEAAVFGGLLAVTIGGADKLWQFLALAFATGVAAALGSPAGRSLTPSLVPPEVLVRALAQRSIAFQVSVVAGPAAGGLLFALAPELVYGFAIGLTLVSAACVVGIKAGRTGAYSGAPGLDSLLAGVRLIRRTPVLFGAISLDLFAVLFGGAVALLPVFAKDVLDVGPIGLGILRTAPAIGSLTAALILARRPIRRRAGPRLLLAVALFGGSIVVFGLSHTMWLSLPALAFGGAVDMVSVVLRQTILPLVTPDEVLGRVNAVEMVFISASNELGAFESGLAAALVGAVPAVLVGGALTIAIAVGWTRFFPALSHVDGLDELRPAAAPPA